MKITADAVITLCVDVGNALIRNPFTIVLLVVGAIWLTNPLLENVLTWLGTAFVWVLALAFELYEAEMLGLALFGLYGS